MMGYRLDIARRLKDEFRFREALKILNTIEKYQKYKNHDKTKLLHLKAQCIYQDRTIKSEIRFQSALEILQENSNDSETERLKGAIYKRWYEYTADVQYLLKAIAHYEEAAKRTEEDMGMLLSIVLIKVRQRYSRR
jgi:tetratricopeptide (TPR) repeat protein